MSRRFNARRGVCAVALALAASSYGTDVGKTPPLRLGVSARTMMHLNRTDVTAAMKVYIETIAEARGIHADPTPYVFDSVEEQAAALKGGEIDVVTAPADEFVVLEQVVPLAGLYSTTIGGRVYENYLLLVRDESPYRALSDLRGGRLMLFTHPTAGLAPAWLDTELLRAGLPGGDGFFGRIDGSTKLNPVILPVFFGQADACVVTKRGFEAAGELNPQISKTLRVLMVSPALVPGVGSHRADLDPAVADRFRDAAFHLGDTTAGRHLLTLFQSDGFVAVSEAEFAPTRAFLAEYDRLVAEANGAIRRTQGGRGGR